MATQLGTVLRHIRQMADASGPDQPTDAQLLERFAARHEEAAFATLVQRFGPLVLGVCRRMLRNAHDAEDAFQATFLILVRKAALIRKPEALGGWLYEVAYRTAARLRASGVLRRLRERQAPQMSSSDSLSAFVWRDLGQVLDDEIRQLPDRARVPFVLCYLQGRTYAQAARQLRCNPRSLSRRLAWARDSLRSRLTRRGLTLSASCLATLLAENAAPAAVPAALAAATVKAGLICAVSHATALALIPSRVAALTEAGITARTLTWGHILLALWLTVSLAGVGVGLWAYRALAGKAVLPLPTQAAKPSHNPGKTGKGSAAQPQEHPKGSAVVTGRVLDPACKPLTGAKVYLVYQTLMNRSQEVQTATAAAGRFRLTVAAPDRDDPWEHMFVLAVAKGYGPGVSTARNPTEAANLTLRLVKDDVPLTGQVLDLQGTPVAGVKVSVQSLGVAAKEDLTGWLKALKANPADAAAVDDQFLTEVTHPLLGKVFPGATTGKDGRFRLAGFGRERVVGLAIVGPTAAYKEVKAMTRPGPALALPSRIDHQGGKFSYYGARFLHAAAPSRPIIGVVRDKDTGQPLAGVTVQSDQLSGSLVSGLALVRAATDRHGRYRLLGMPLGAGNRLKVMPGADQPYLLAEKEVRQARDLTPATVNFDLKRGVWIKGRVTDKATGKPWKAQIEYFVFADNPHLRDAPGFTTDHYLETSADGSFRLVGMPGRGLVVARAWGDRWLMAAGADKIKGRDERGFFRTAPHLCIAQVYHSVVEVNPGRGAGSVTCNVALDPGRAIKGTVQGPDGKPLAGVLARGLIAYGGGGQWDNYPLKTAAFTVFGLAPGGSREIIFLHLDKRLAGALVVRGDQKGPCSVRIQPWGTVGGRLVGKDGRPRSGVDLMVLGEPLLPSWCRLPTGKDGKFQFTGLVPGRPYYLLEMKDRFTILGQVNANLKVKAGQTRDLGDVRVVYSKTDDGP